MIGHWFFLLRSAASVSDVVLLSLALAGIVALVLWLVWQRRLSRIGERLALQAATIDQQRRMLDALLDRIDEAIIVATRDGRIRMINPAAIRMLNLAQAGQDGGLIGGAADRCIPQYELQQMLRMSPSQGKGDGPDDTAAAELVEPPSNKRARLQIVTDRGVLHLLARASDIQLPPTRVGPSPSYDGRLLVLTDISELSRTFQIKADFVANASHELRTPLTSIRTAVETLSQMDLANESQAAAHFIHVADRHVDRLEALVNDLLDLSRLESPTARFDAEQLDLRAHVAELHDRFADTLRRKGLEWISEFVGDDGQVILAHPYLVRLVLDNLVDNAIKFTEPGGFVRVASRRETGKVTIEVEDNGCGIAEEEQQRVFERFYQVERARSGPERGTGLGLSIVRHAVAALQGGVTLHSKPGEGTRVAITLPQPD